MPMLVKAVIVAVDSNNNSGREVGDPVCDASEGSSSNKTESHLPDVVTPYHLLQCNLPARFSSSLNKLVHIFALKHINHVINKT